MHPAIIKEDEVGIFASELAGRVHAHNQKQKSQAAACVALLYRKHQSRFDDPRIISVI